MSNTRNMPNSVGDQSCAVTSSYPHGAGSISSHYAQALANWQPFPVSSTMNAHGYTLPSTYNAQASGSKCRLEDSPSYADAAALRPIRLSLQTQHNEKLNSGNQSHGAWYQTGNARCTYKDCAFMGSQKALEIHRMDRHLIYPPGYRKEVTWDTDPSLKGKLIPIFGTSIVLDTPDVVDAWIAERKKRWPSTARVQDLKQKETDARARGQLSIADPALLGKRRRDAEESYQVERKATRGRGRDRGRGRGRGQWEASFDESRATDSGWGRGRGGIPRAAQALKSNIALISHGKSDDESDLSKSESDDAPEETMIERQVEETEMTAENEVLPVTDIKRTLSVQRNTNTKRAAPLLQPRRPARNPFASRPTLLRNLLLPEIRMTVSNLSQAIRFLVDNDFLDGVELSPGDAEKRAKIEILASSESKISSHDTVPENENSV